MDSPTGSPQRSSGIRRRATILGSVTIPGRPEQVSGARAFIARTITEVPSVDSDVATLLTSELVTNAIQHTNSGTPGGTVTVVVIRVPGGVLIEVADDGSAGTPVVKGDLYAAEGHGLFLVQQFATQWGYLRDQTGTTVWFHLPGEEGSPASYPLAAPTVASAAATTAAQMRSTSPSLVRYGGIV